jgi:single-strand DNA-binding protein
MPDLNKVLLIGRLVADPELRYTHTGTAVADIRLAINRRFGSGDDRKEETCLVDVVFWQSQAELVHRYLSKGRPVYVEGRLKLDTWETKEGEKRQKLRVVAERFEALGGREDLGTTRVRARTDSRLLGAAPPASPASSAGAPAVDEIADEIDFPSDELPF